MEKHIAQQRLAHIAQELSIQHSVLLERLKAEHDQLNRTDFIWHYLLQSFATMGRALGWNGLIGNKDNYEAMKFNVLAELKPEVREQRVYDICRRSGIRMPNRKAQFILSCFDRIVQLGGLKETKSKLLNLQGRDAKVQFLDAFPGIGPKYARNIMMDVYHDDFRESIALDIRIKAISDALGLAFDSYEAHENFYLQAAHEAGLNGWEMDRLLFNFKSEFLARLNIH